MNVYKHVYGVHVCVKRFDRGLPVVSPCAKKVWYKTQ